MELVAGDEGKKELTVGGAFYLPVTEDLGVTMQATKVLTADRHRLIVQDAGLEAPNDLPTDRLCYTALSIVQNAWYQAVKGAVPANIVAGHNDRMARHLAAVREVSAPANQSSIATTSDLPALPSNYTPDIRPTDVSGVYQVELAGITPAIYLHLKRPGGHATSVEQLRELQDARIYRAIVVAAGYVFPDAASDKEVYLLAAGVVSRWWHEAANEHGVLVKGELDRTPANLSDNYDRDQRLRYQRCLRSSEPLKKSSSKAQPKQSKPPKEPKAPKPPKEPKAPTEKTIRTRHSEALVFKCKGDGSGLKASMKQIWDAVVACGPDGAPLVALIDEVVKAGFTTKEPAGPGPRVRWLALELAKKGILEVVQP